MKKVIYLAIITLAISMFFIGCGGKKKEFVEVKELVPYTDQTFSLSINYPINWVTRKVEKGFVAYSSQDGISRFESFDPEGYAGARIFIYAVELKDEITFDTVVNSKTFAENCYGPLESVVIDGINGKKQSYQFELTDGMFNGDIYFAAKDTKFATVIKFEAFGGSYKDYKPAFDKILSSIKLAVMPTKKVDTITKITEQPLPSQNLAQVKGDGFVISIPDNFDTQHPKVAKVINSYRYIGERRADSEIRIDIIDASKNKKLQKIVDDNKVSHQNAVPQKVTFAGQEAFVFTYSPVAKVMSKVYYTIKGDRLYRITMNWSTDEKDVYLPIFEKSMNSFKFQ